MNGLTPQQQGFALETLIHTQLSKIHGLECLREQDIRNRYDQSFNGIDHWIIRGNHSILIQDKWCETNTQHESTQFIHCAERIKMRCPNMTYTLLWACKKRPGRHALATLSEEGVIILVHDSSIEQLAQLVASKVCQKFGVSQEQRSASEHAILIIPTPTAPPPSSVQPVLHSSRQQSTSWDNTQTGRNAIQNLKRTIQSIQKLFRLVRESLHDTKLPVIHQIVANAIPASESDWTSGKFKSIDYFAFAEQIESICRPSPYYTCSENDYMYFVRVCSVSKQLVPLVKEYNQDRQRMLRANSQYVNTIPTLDSHEKLLPYEIYTSLLKYCYDYSRD